MYETQKLTTDNDKFKNKLCENNNIILLRYWEKDINERPEWVISDLREKLSKYFIKNKISLYLTVRTKPHGFFYG